MAENLSVSAVKRPEAWEYYLLYSSESAETAAVGDSGCTRAFDIDLLIETVKLFFDRNTIVVKRGENITESACNRGEG